MQPSFIEKLGLHNYKANMGAQKIDGSRFETFGMIITLFQVDNKEGKSCFFHETFLPVDIRIDDSFRMFFLILSNVKANFKSR